MVNLVLNSTTKQLGKKFGDSYHYYVESVEQNLTKPCFTVDTLIPLQRSKSPVLYDRTVPLVIHYFTDDKKNLKSKLYDMGEQIVECLEILKVGDALIRGEDISWHIVDEVLQVFVTYKFTTIKAQEVSEVMETFVETVAHTN